MPSNPRVRKRSTSRAPTAPSGIKIRGKYTLETSCWLVIRLLLDWVTEAEKNVHGARPQKAKSLYGGPSLCTWASRLKMKAKISMAMKGCRTAQSPPSKVCRYRIFTSRQIRKANSSWYTYISLKSTACQPFRGRIVSSKVLDILLLARVETLISKLGGVMH